MRKWMSLLAAIGCLVWFEAVSAESIRFYCGAYTRSKTDNGEQARGIGAVSLNLENGSMRIEGESSAILNPSHLCMSPDGRFLYSVSEIGNYDAFGEGSVTAFRVDPESGILEQLQSIRSYGAGPCYVSLDRSGKFALVANYRGGTAAAIPIVDEGKLGEATSVVQHEGGSVNPSRQAAPHPHSIVASPDNHFVYVPDLGIDRIVAYQVDSSNGKLSPRPEFDVATPPGSGPRHLVFDPQGQFAYVSLEMTSEVAAYRYDDGVLKEIGRDSTLPDGFGGDNSTAEVRTSPDGKTVYISNRGHDSIAVFRVGKGGALEKVQVMSTGGKTPRNFGIDPSGRFLIAANQNSHTLVSFRIDPETGKLDPTGEAVKTPFPVFICFQNHP